MLKFIYKFIGLIFTSFIIFIFIINYSFLSFKESIFLKTYYSIKINIIYYIFYIIYMFCYFKYIRKRNMNKY